MKISANRPIEGTRYRVTEWGSSKKSYDPECRFFRSSSFDALYCDYLQLSRADLGAIKVARLLDKIGVGAFVCSFVHRRTKKVSAVLSLRIDDLLSRMAQERIAFARLFLDSDFSCELLSDVSGVIDRFCCERGITLVRCKADSEMNVRRHMNGCGYEFYAATCRLGKKVDRTARFAADEFDMIDLKDRPDRQQAALGFFERYEGSERFSNPYLRREVLHRYYEEWFHLLLKTESSFLFGIVEPHAKHMIGVGCISRSGMMRETAVIHTLDFLALAPGYRFRHIGSAILSCMEHRLPEGTFLEGSHMYDNKATRNLLSRLRYVNTHVFDFYTKRYRSPIPESE